MIVPVISVMAAPPSRAGTVAEGEEVHIDSIAVRSDVAGNRPEAHQRRHLQHFKGCAND